MNVPRLFKRTPIRWRTLHKALTICVLVSLLAGLIPPPLVRSALPQTAADLAAALLPAPSVAQAAGGSITGTVFQDYNADGVRNTTSTTSLTAVDNGVGDVTVTAYDADGSQCGQTTTSTTSATLGQYTLAHTCTASTVRVEFTGLPTDYQSGPQGTNSGTSVQFVSATASNVNYGINHPCDYCQNAPTLATTYMIAGNQMTNTGVSSLPNTKVVVSFGYNSTTTTGAPTGEAMAKQVGTTVGLAYQRSTKTIFVGAYMKRHAGFGPGGPGAIYSVNPGADGVRGNTDDVVNTFLDLDSAAYFGAGSFGVDPHPTSTENIAQTPYNWFHDNQSLDDVSKMAFGDLDMSEDDQDLYTVNLFDRALYRIPVGNPPVAPSKAAIITVSVPITLPNTGANALVSGSASNQHQTCASGDVRPFGLGIYRQAVYVGLVCSAQSTQAAANLRAYVYSFDPTTNAFDTAPVLEFPLNYTRSGNFTQSWKPYMDTFATLAASTATDGMATFTNYPQPILSDIAFDRGAMVLGFRDRAGDQLGKYAGDVGTGAPGNFYYVAASGDLLRACANGSGWSVENDGSCGGVTTTGSSSTNAGPGGGEFYLGDKAPYPSGTNHVEASEGTLAQVPGAPEVIMSAIDATGLNSGGFEWLNNTTGLLADAYEVYQSTSPSGAPSSPSTSATPDTTFGKAGGIGDVEALCDPAPIQIGNRVWNDANSNGIQDPGESPIQNITVELYKAGTKVGQATTNAQGEYYFTSGTSSTDSNTSDNVIHDGGVGIRSATGTAGGASDYEIRIPNVTGGSKQAALGTNVLTTANAGSKESIDSDGTIPSGQSYARYAIPHADLASAGYNDHTYDFGFGPQPTTGTIQIVKNTVGDNGTFDFTSTDTQLDAVSITTVGNTGNSGAAFTKNAGSYTISEDALPANWALTSLNCTGDTDNGSVVTLASRQVTIELDADEDIVCTFTNTYTAPPPPPAGSGVLTITKTVQGNPGGVTDYAVTVNGPSGYVTNTTLTAGGSVVLTGLANGVYTVTETSPGAGWTTVYTATPGTGGSTNAVVNLGAITAAETAPGTITGTVFRDYNSNGTRNTTNTTTSQAVDDGQAGVVVTAYDRNGAVAGSATTAANGAYTLTTTLAGPYRLEFTNLPAGYEPARVADGADNGTSVQFVSAPASGVDFGIAYPADYCQDNPTLCMPGYYNGDASSTSLASMYRMSYTGTSPTSIATQAQMGAAWGVAYQRSRGRVFAAATVRRHAGLGPLGLGGVYVFNTPSGAGGFTNFIDLENAPYSINFGSLGSNSTRGLPATVTQPNHDATAFDAVGKQGIGDIDMAEDGNYLWLVNLNLRTLVKLDVSGTSAGAATSYAIASMTGAPTCTGGVLRPWALKFYRGLGYLGAVCSAETTRVAANLMGYVLSFNPNNPTSLTTVLTIPLDYQKGPASFGDPVAMRFWAPWHSATSVDYTVNTNRTPTPILADIEFDRKGALILGFIDRTGMQFGSFNYTPNTSSTSTIDYRVSGDILRACPDGSGLYVLESNSTCAGVQGNFPSPIEQPQGPGGGEFYAGDFTYAGNHFEIALGALAYLPGATQVVIGAMNPDDANTSLNFSNGAKWLWNEDYDGVNGAGLNARGVVFVRGLTGASVGAGTQNGAMGKAYGLGDVEILCDLAPTEIGNRVWNDINGNGVQDPGEPGLNGITVSRQGPTNTVTAVTSVDGNYYFNVKANTAYTVTITPPAGYGLTAANAQALAGASVTSNHAISDTRDSDAVLVGGMATIYYTTGSAGQNNHGLDFGFTQPASGQVDILNTAPNFKVSIGNLVWEDGNDNGLYDVGEDLIDNLTMELWIDLDNDGLPEPLGDDGSTPLSTTVTVNGIYSFTDLLPDAYFVRIPNPPAVTPLSSIPSDAPDNGVDNDDNGSQPAGPNTQILSPVIILAGGDEPGQGGGGNDDMTVDFGLVDPFLGNLVWYDKNNNGVVDADEPGIPDVTVQLFYDADDSGTIDAGETTPFRTTTTDDDGIYVFPDLVPASNYQVVVPQSNFVAGGALALYRYSSDTTDTNDNQEDEDDNGIQASPGLTTTAPLVRLTVDEEPIDGGAETGRGNDLDNGDDNNGDMTVDFGFYSMGTIQIVKQATGGDDTFTFSSADGDLDGVSLTTSGGVASSAVITKMVGTYTLSETLLADWHLIGISVSGDSDNGSSKDLVNGAIAIDLDANEQIVVTFKNIKGELPTGSSALTITKSVVGNPGNITSYTVVVDGSTGYYTETTVTPGTPTVLTGLAAGIYTVTETSPGAGWVMTYTVDAVASNTQGVVDLTNALNVTPVTASPISGKVFRDYNSDGQITTNGTVTDTGVSGVTVTAYDKDGNNVGRATTASDGAYTINPTADGPYRVEFSNLPAGFEPTTHETGNGTSVQFVTTSGASNVNLGIHKPGQYCQSNPYLATSCMLSGDQSGTQDVLVKFPYNASGQTSVNEALAQANEIGSTWGLAYNRATREIYAAAFIKRHAGLGGSGLGAIYTIDSSGTNIPALWLDIETLAGVDVGSVATNSGRGLSSTHTAPSEDASVFAKVAKEGIGDIDISPDDRTLYVTNLFSKKLIAIDTATKAKVGEYTITDPGCTNGVFRPFAVKTQDADVYVGGVCDASSGTATNLVAYILKLNGGSFSTVFSFPLNYTKGVPDVSGGCHVKNGWLRWSDTSVTTSNCTSGSYATTGTGNNIAQPQPVLSDIEFAPDGSIIVALMDRASHQYGDQNWGTTNTDFNHDNTRDIWDYIPGGDILKICYNGGTYALEGSSGCPSNFANNEGPSGKEFYEDAISGYGNNHHEVGLGALAAIPSLNEVVATVQDPFAYTSAGTYVLNNSTGVAIRKYEVRNGRLAAGLFGKAGGLGDIEAICDAAPLEIGNRVWDDIDGDGIPDPGEPGLNGVQVSLQGPTNTVNVNTSGDGNYYFTVQPNTDYTITVATPSGYYLTLGNEDSVDGLSASSNHAISDTRDSDAILVGGVATIHYTTGNAGQNNHGLDFGFTQPVNGQVDIVNEAPKAPKVSLGNRVWYDTNNDGSVTTGEQNVVDGVVVELYQDSDGSGDFSAGDSRVASTVTSGGYYTFTGLTPSSSDATRYLVVITATNFLPGGLLYGYHSSDGAVTDNSLAADNDKDHGAVSGTLGQAGGVVASGAISLTTGTQPTGEANEGNDPIQSSSDADSNQTIDFGFYSLSVGNRVWIDNGGGNSANADNGQLDSGESGLNGVTVELLDSANSVVSTTTTSNGGYYTFTGLISGTYSVRISGYSASYRSSIDTVNASAPTNADDDDNGLGTGAGTLTSQPFALVPGNSANGHSANNATGVTSNPRIDFGLYEPPASFALDKRLVSPVSGIAAVGDSVVYDLVITNTGAITLTSVTLVDSYDAAYLQYNSASLNPTAQASGVLTWTLTSPTTPLPLSAGETMTVTVTFTAVKP